MTTTSTSSNNNNSSHDPLVLQVDNDNAMAYPTAQVVLLDDDADGSNNVNQTPSSPAYPSSDDATPYYNNSRHNVYAPAQVLGDPATTEFGLSPQTEYNYHGYTETYATATPLDPLPKPTSYSPQTSDHLLQNGHTATTTTSTQGTEQLQQLTVATTASSNPPNINGPEAPLLLVGLEDPLHKKKRRRKRRRARMIVSGVTGFFVGSFLGPVGAIAGAFSAAAITRAASKAGEKRKDKRLERQVAQLYEQQHR